MIVSGCLDKSAREGLTDGCNGESFWLLTITGRRLWLERHALARFLRMHRNSPFQKEVFNDLTND